jgi:hypothetical protein
MKIPLALILLALSITFTAVKAESARFGSGTNSSNRENFYLLMTH